MKLMQGGSIHIVESLGDVWDFLICIRNIQSVKEKNSLSTSPADWSIVQTMEPSVSTQGTFLYSCFVNF